MKQPGILFYGVLFLIGLLTQIITSVTWQNFSNTEVGEKWFMCGQALGELCYFFIARRFFSMAIELRLLRMPRTVKAANFVVLAVEFGMSLILVDLVDILLLDPYSVSLPKYSGFVIAFVVLMLRSNKLFKPHE